MPDEINFRDSKPETDLGNYYLTSVGVSMSEEDFRFAFTSHNVSRFYTASPKHAKRILHMLQDRICEYEKKFGELKTTVPSHKKRNLEPVKVGFKCSPK